MSSELIPLDIDRLEVRLREYSRKNLHEEYSGKISYFASIDSTNAWLLEHGKEGDVCISEKQTAGRGRRDNKWISPECGNIYLSFCCRLDNAVSHRSLLGLVVGIAIAEALQEIGLTGHGIKWPNDILWRHQKLGGILIQTADNYEKFIIGIGLNVKLPEQSRSEITQAAVSIEEAIRNKQFERDELVVQLIQRLLFHTETFSKMSFPAFLLNWKRWDILQGQEVSFDHKDEEVSGVVDGIDEHGRIGILLEKNTEDETENDVEYFSAADVRLKKRI